MTHAPAFWERKLDPSHRHFFWELIAFGFGGETAYHRTVEHFRAAA